jgi:hypothetical protein
VIKSTSFIFLLTFTFLTGCVSNIELSDESKYKPSIQDVLPKPQPARGNTYVREVTVDEVLTQEVKSIAANDITLIEVFADIMPDYQVVPGDPGVNLDQRIRIRQHEMNLLSFLDYIEKLTGYEVEVKADRLIIRSFITKTWNLAAFSDSRASLNRSVSTQTVVVGDGDEGGGSSGSSTNTIESELLKEHDEFANLLAGAEKHLGIDSESSSGEAVEGGDFPEIALNPAPVDFDSPDPLSLDAPGGLSSPIEAQASTPVNENYEEKPYVHGIRSLGIVTAAGKVPKIRNLDKYFKTALRSSEVMFNVQASIYEVTLNEKKEKGIDWSALTTGTLNGNPFDLTFEQNRNPNLSEGLFSATGSYTGSDFNLSSTVSFLEEFGDVDLIDQPSISSRNGVPVKISRPEELSYIADFAVETNEDNDLVVIPSLSRLSVGVTLAVTARLLSEDKILLDIWPVISSINGSDSFSIGDFNFDTPRISRKELTTQVITTSGKPVYLGGVITKRIAKTLSGLPISSSNGISGVLKAPFEQASNSIERKELVMVVTPTIIESSL